MTEYVINFILDYVVITSNPILLHKENEEEAIAVAQSYVKDSGIDISNIKYSIDVEVF